MLEFSELHYFITEKLKLTPFDQTRSLAYLLIFHILLIDPRLLDMVHLVGIILK